MRSGLGTWVAVAALSTGVAAAAAQPVPPKAEAWQPDLLQRWLAAAEQHEPGEIDVPLIDATTWTRADLRRLWVDAQVLWEFVQQSKKAPTRLRVRPLYPTRQRPWVDVRLDVSGRTALVTMSDRIREHGVTGFLRRAVMVHTDVATLAANRIETDDEPVPMTAPVLMNVGDGRSNGAEAVSLHWDLARLVVEHARAADRQDPWPRDWFRATLALAQRVEMFDGNHLRYGLRLMPDDPWLLFLAGCHHEAMASPLFQEFARPYRGSTMRPDMASEGDELAAAEDAFRRALRVDPAFVEARVRLGRVLGRRGRHEEARRELRAALDQSPETVVAYYAQLFLAVEHEAAADPTAAAAAYEQAATLAPAAPLPHLALARLAHGSGDRAAQVHHLERALAARDAQDPWWFYRGSQARASERWMAEVQAAVPRATP